MSNMAENETHSADKKTVEAEVAAPKTDSRPATEAPPGGLMKSPTAAPKSDNKH